MFHSKVNGKNDLIFIVEMNDENKFGGFTSEKIIIEQNSYPKINKENSFLFSLKSNAHDKGMIQFKPNEQQQFNQNIQQGGFGGGFRQSQRPIQLFSFASDLTVNIHYNLSSLYQNDYNYNGIQNLWLSPQQNVNNNNGFNDMNAFRTNNNYNNFTPKRILVYQMK